MLTRLVIPAYGLERQGMAVLEGPDFTISRGDMPRDPPRGSRLLALGPLFTNFLDTPLIRVFVSKTFLLIILHWSITYLALVEFSIPTSGCRGDL